MDVMAKVKRNAKGWFNPEGVFESRGGESPWTFDSKLELGYIHALAIYIGNGHYLIAGKREALERNKGKIAKVLKLKRAIVYDEGRFYLGDFTVEDFVRAEWPKVVGQPTPPGLEHFSLDMTKPRQK